MEPWLNYCPYNNLMSPENPFFFFLSQCLWLTGGFPGGTGGKEPVCYAGGIWDLSSIPGLGRPPGGEHGNPLQYSCLENPTDRGGWWATVKRVAKSQTELKRLSRQAHTWLTGSQFPGRSLGRILRTGPPGNSRKILIFRQRGQDEKSRGSSPNPR